MKCQILSLSLAGLSIPHPKTEIQGIKERLLSQDDFFVPWQPFFRTLDQSTGAIMGNTLEQESWSLNP